MRTGRPVLRASSEAWHWTFRSSLAPNAPPFETWVTRTLGSSTPSGRKVAPGLHGHSLDSVSVAGTTLQTGSTNTIPASPAPTFTLNFTNSGTKDETNVVCRVAVSGTGVSGQTVVPKTTAGQHGSCKVTLSSKPSTGTVTVQATVEGVPGEKKLDNNKQSYTAIFQR